MTVLLPAALHALKEEASTLVENALKHLKCSTLKGEKGDRGQDGLSIRGEKGESGLTPTKEMVENLVAAAMNESQLLDETCEYAGPLLKFAIKKELGRLAVEQK